ncbi:hypothetical protein Dimus_007753, partial [Dionaea muscipula]
SHLAFPFLLHRETHIQPRRESDKSRQTQNRETIPPAAIADQHQREDQQRAAAAWSSAGRCTHPRRLIYTTIIELPHHQEIGDKKTVTLTIVSI